MAFLVSPGVEVKEIDLTGIIPAVSSSIGGYAGKFQWGPVDELVNVSDEKDLARNFGTPTKALARSYFTAASFLRYSNALLVSRAVNSDALNASSTGTNVLIKNLDSFESATNYSAIFYARYPGEIGNSLQILVQPAGIQTRFDILDFSIVNDNIILTLKDKAATAPGAGALKHYQEMVMRDVRSNGDLITQLENTNFFYIGDIDDSAEDGTVTGKIYTDAGLNTPFNTSSYTNTTITASGYIEHLYNHYFSNSFVHSPGTSVYASKYGVENDELNILIIDKNGKFTGTPGTILEAYENVSAGVDAKKENGETNYYRDVINRSSRYIYANNLNGIITGAGGSIKEGASFATVSNGGPIFNRILKGGTDGDLLENDGVIDALELFADPEVVDVNLIFAENDTENNITVAKKLIQLVENRKDCVAFISPDLEVKDQPTEDQKLDKVINKFDRLDSSSYVVFDSSPLQLYDKYNDEYIWVPASGAVAGLCANTDNVRDPWWSPAGYNRGQLRGIAKIGFNPKQNQRDELYKARVNPIVSFPGEGIILYGDKTGLAKPSAFDRINVRRLFIVLEKAIATASKYQLFEFNDEFTRAQFRNMVNPYLRDVQGRRGITDFIVVCDETNNTGEVIDSNRFVADIYIKPARAINFITLNFVATRTGVEFSEVIGKF